MSVKDFIKKSVLESDMYNQAISLSTIITIVIDLAVALGMGLLIYYIYKRFYKGVVYSRNYAMTLVGMTVLTCMVTLAISTNVIISLGMVGALSIVRYRTAIKEPLDLMYMFWAITTGITVGASMYILAILAAVIMIVFIFMFSKDTNFGCSYMMIVHYKGDTTGDEVIRHLSNVKHNIRSKTLRGEDNEMTVQLKCKNNNLSFAEKIRSLELVNDVTVLEYSGEYHG
ncbi:MAG: DUF4956 domain-containing protein [bacterium]|nr:DUF4956 domain-containing protein [bacterium]